MEKVLNVEVNEVLLRIAKELYEVYISKKEALPYSLNIISELHANENAHSRILRGLLQYNRNGEFPILQSFVERIGELADCKVDVVIKKPELTNEESRIDLLIKEGKSYAIIIENKIRNAPDQVTQIERYIDYVEGLGIPRRKIYVVYLTYDGQKEISDCSLTPKAQKFLGCSRGSNGRFVCMNYKDDIMPWLDELLDLKEIQDEPLMQSSVIQYNDYLKTVFDARKEDIEIENELEEQLMDKLQIKSLQELLQTWDDVSKLEDIVSSAVNNRINELCEKKICNVLKKKGYTIKASEFRYDYFDLEIEVPEWTKCWWAMVTDKRENLYSGVWCDPNKKVAKKYVSMMRDVFDETNEDRFIGGDWFGDYELNDEFWLNLESHPKKFVNSIVNELERVRESTKGMKL